MTSSLSSLNDAIREHIKRLQREADEQAKEEADREAVAAKYPAIKVGAQVTIKEGECEAWYSGYGNNPVFDNFKPGMIGTVGSIAAAKVSAPKIKPHGWCDYYVCIDYVDSNNHEVRCKAEYSNIEVLNDAQTD